MWQSRLSGASLPSVEDHVAIDADIFTPARQAVAPARSTARR